MSNSSKKISFNNKKQRKTAQRHVLRIVIIDVIIIGAAYFKGLFSSGNSIQTTLVVLISLLSIFQLGYVIYKTYHRTITSVEFYDPNTYNLKYKKWFSEIITVKVSSKEIKLAINKVDPNSRTIGYSKITFKSEGQSIQFKVTLEDLKRILLFCWKHIPFSINKSDLWDMKEISSYKGFEELKTITTQKSCT